MLTSARVHTHTQASCRLCFSGEPLLTHPLRTIFTENILHLQPDITSPLAISQAFVPLILPNSAKLTTVVIKTPVGEKYDVEFLAVL